MPPKVFISAGTPANEMQRSFRDAVINAIELCGFEPRLMGKKDWDFKNPLRGVRRAMNECRGAVVVAYARYEVDAGLELRESGSKALTSAAFPTAWNQIEAAMAYEKGLPLLVIAEERLRREALLDSGADVRPFLTPLDRAIARSDGFQGYLRSWKEDVEQHAREPVSMAAQLREFTTGQVLSALPWYELLAVGVTLIGALLAAVSIGYRLGSGQWPLG